MDEQAEVIGPGKDARRIATRLLDFAVDICGFIFLTSFLVYLVFQVMEMLREGSVTYFTDPDRVLYLCAATGAIYILANRYGSAAERVTSDGISLRRVLPATAAAAILTGLLTYRLMSEYGVYAILIAVAAAILTCVAGYAVFSPAE